MSASAEYLKEMRAVVFKTVCGCGAGEEVAETARLVAGELVGNAVRLCGPWTPVVVQVFHMLGRVVVQVHDPEPAEMPARGPQSPDNTDAETGRGLWILDALAPGWSVQPTPVGKQVTCTLLCPEFAAA
ncbi:ATP-binding protein [Streptomyces sp. NPDC088246]|uniref:ATP-binding protein n=1 Tax=Streptomyces sp. NPDC088246 TaxID=3365842 RepID=UPI003801C644